MAIKRQLLVQIVFYFLSFGKFQLLLLDRHVFYQPRPKDQCLSHRLHSHWYKYTRVWYSFSIYSQRGLRPIHMVIIYIQKHNAQCEVVEKHITRSILQHNIYMYMSRYCFLSIVYKHVYKQIHNIKKHLHVVAMYLFSIH